MKNINEKPKQFLNDLLREMGVNRSYFGFRDTINALKLITENEDLLYNLGHIYELVAKAPRQAGAIESAIQRVSDAAWNNNKKLLQAYDDTLLAAPSNREFLEILLWYWNHPEKFERSNT